MIRPRVFEGPRRGAMRSGKVAGDRFEARVRAVVDELAPQAAAADAVARLCAWLDKLAAWNQRMDLTAAQGDDELVDLMVADAALLATALAPGVRVVDVGCGAGAPGLGLAMLRPDLALTLVEPLGRRATFLRLVSGTLPAPVPEVRGERAERLTASWQVALSRATLPPPEWLAQGARLAPEGEVWVLLAQLDAPALAGWQVARDLDYRWPLTGRRRRALCYRPLEQVA